MTSRGKGAAFGRQSCSQSEGFLAESHAPTGGLWYFSNILLHHLFSDHETRLFYILEWSDVVIDIREQFPLLDLDLAQRISADIGVKYPIDTTSKFPVILTTDFIVTVKQNGKTFDVALTVKPSSELKNKRVIEKFEIERNYYMAKGIEWGIVTEKHISKSLAKNIE